ncbi:hypothetical protein WY02_07610 [Pseudonocardia sp. AL041005-10]|nr:hypothetical protein WY02_07610 [Pseudonocardia sp. AL041005-10]
MGQSSPASTSWPRSQGSRSTTASRSSRVGRVQCGQRTPAASPWRAARHRGTTVAGAGAS